MQDDTTMLNSLSISQQQSLGHEIVSQWKQWKAGRYGLETTWQACWDAYLCKNPTNSNQEGTDSLRSSVTRPVLYEAVETIHSQLLNALFSNGGRFFTVLGATEKDQANAKLIEDYLRDKLDTLHFEDKFATFLKQAIITGNSIASVPWKNTSALVKQHETVEILGVSVGTKPITTKMTTYEGPDFEVIDMFDVVIDPQCINFEEATIIRQLHKTVNELTNSGSYTNIEKIKSFLQTKSDKQTSPKKTSRLPLAEETSNSLSPSAVTVYEAWGTFEIEGVTYKDYVASVTDWGLLIRFEPSGYSGKPFVMTNFIAIPNELYGIGAIEKSLGLQQAINTLTNQKLDVIAISINNPFTYLINDDVFDPNSVVTRPGALIPVKSHDTLRPIQYLNNYTVAFNEIADLKTEVQEATGAFKYLSGSISGGEAGLTNRTATEVSALIQGGTQKYSNLLAHIEQTALEPFLNMAFKHCQAFSQETMLTMKGTHSDGSTCFYTLPLRVLQTARCHFKISGSRASFIKGKEIENLSLFINLIQQAPLEIAAQINTLELYKRIYRRLGFNDEQDIFGTTTH